MVENSTSAELDFVEDMLMKYGNDDSILDVSELDGLLTAIVSGPNMIMPSQWLPDIWGAALIGVRLQTANIQELCVGWGANSQEILVS